MKLSFTTLGCPQWPLEKIIQNAASYGFDAVDFRGLAGEMNIYKLPEFSDRVAETLALITDSGLTVSCFSSSVNVFSSESFAKNIEEIKQYTRLCEFFGSPYIRVFGGKIGTTDRAEAIRVTADQLREMAKVAGASNVKLLVETHDDWVDSRHMQELLRQTDSDAVGVLWDLHHPYRMIDEQPEETWNRIGPWIEYVHVKDSFPLAGDKHPFQYCLTGKGDIPLRRMISLLEQNGYQGYFTLEWEKKWHPTLADGEVAFPQYVQYMRSLEAEVL